MNGNCGALQFSVNCFCVMTDENIQFVETIEACCVFWYILFLFICIVDFFFLKLIHVDNNKINEKKIRRNTTQFARLCKKYRFRFNYSDNQLLFSFMLFAFARQRVFFVLFSIGIVLSFLRRRIMKLICVQ